MRASFYDCYSYSYSYFTILTSTIYVVSSLLILLLARRGTALKRRGSLAERAYRPASPRAPNLCSSGHLAGLGLLEGGLEFLYMSYALFFVVDAMRLLCVCYPPSRKE